MNTPANYVARLFAALTLWTLLPLYIQLFEAAGHFEVMAHRVVWACLFLAAYLYAQQGGAFVRTMRALALPTLALLLLSGMLIATNWLTYIYAVQNDNVLQASLGYFILPLLSIFMGFVVFKENITPLQWTSIALAAAGIAYLIFFYGGAPWIALTLALSFGMYSTIHKKIKLNANLSLLTETLYLLPFTLLYLAWLARNEQLFFLSHGVGYDLGIMGLGLMSVVPLILFNHAIKHIPFLIVGFIQFYLPSTLFLIGVLWFDEPFATHYQITFGLIWLAVIIFIYDILRRRTRPH